MDAWSVPVGAVVGVEFPPVVDADLSAFSASIPVAVGRGFCLRKIGKKIAGWTTVRQSTARAIMLEESA